MATVFMWVAALLVTGNIIGLSMCVYAKYKGDIPEGFEDDAGFHVGAEPPPHLHQPQN